MKKKKVTLDPTESLTRFMYLSKSQALINTSFWTREKEFDKFIVYTVISMLYTWSILIIIYQDVSNLVVYRVFHVKVRLRNGNNSWILKTSSFTLREQTKGCETERGIEMHTHVGMEPNFIVNKWKFRFNKFPMPIPASN